MSYIVRKMTNCQFPNSFVSSFIQEIKITTRITALRNENEGIWPRVLVQPSKRDVSSGGSGLLWKSPGFISGGADCGKNSWSPSSQLGNRWLAPGWRCAGHKFAQNRDCSNLNLKRKTWWLQKENLEITTRGQHDACYWRLHDQMGNPELWSQTFTIL